MSGKCVLISSCVSFLLLPAALYGFAELVGLYMSRPHDIKFSSLILYTDDLEPVEFSLVSQRYFNSPSLNSFIRASSAENTLSGLAVYSNLKNACQPLDDVNNANIQVPKIALVTLVSRLVDESTCTLQDLAVNAQNAGYSVLIYYGSSTPPSPKLPAQKLMISVAELVRTGDERIQLNSETVNSYFFVADRTNVDILCSNTGFKPDRDELGKMKYYLKRLYYWFLVGPLITIEWLRRTKKLCWMSGGQQVDEGQTANVAESEIRTMEEGGNGNERLLVLSNPRLPTNDDESIGTHQAQETSREGRGGEEQPLFIPDENTRQLRGSRCVDDIKKIFHKGVLCFAYVILIIAALPIAISIGGVSFFRFDQDIDRLIGTSFFSDDINNYIGPAGYFIGLALTISLWSPFQIFCFFLYSRFACNSTWTVPTNFSKLIRSDWFASNIYLLVLAVVVPYCSSSPGFLFFAVYSIVCTVCNMLFIIIVNKHKFVTRYVFYTSVCMICAYIQSDIVAVFYFALNSEGSLNNLKLTALRTVAIGLTLTVSFSSSMHIIRKLTKPQESLFEGLSER